MGRSLESTAKNILELFGTGREWGRVRFYFILFIAKLFTLRAIRRVVQNSFLADLCFSLNISILPELAQSIMIFHAVRLSGYLYHAI